MRNSVDGTLRFMAMDDKSKVFDSFVAEQKKKGLTNLREIRYAKQNKADASRTWADNCVGVVPRSRAHDIVPQDPRIQKWMRSKGKIQNVSDRLTKTRKHGLAVDPVDETFLKEGLHVSWAFSDQLQLQQDFAKEVSAFAMCAANRDSLVRAGVLTGLVHLLSCPVSDDEFVLLDIVRCLDDLCRTHEQIGMLKEIPEAIMLAVTGLASRLMSPRRRKARF